MRVWFDIDDSSDIPLTKAVIDELSKRGHTVVITAQGSNDMKNSFKKYNLQAEFIGFAPFNLFPNFSDLIRASLLSNYIKKQNINLAFSLGSAPLLYTSIDLNVQVILFLKNYQTKTKKLYFNSKNVCFIIPDSFNEEILLEKGSNIKRFAKLKEHVEENNPNSIKEIATKIETLSTHHDVQA